MIEYSFPAGGIFIGELSLLVIIKNLIKKFGSRTIIDDFSLQFPTNAKIAIIGANGAGKTTLLNMICGFEEYEDGGEIIIPKGCNLGYLPQSPCENPKLTILEECISGNSKLCDLQERLNESLLNIADDYDTYEKIENEFSDNNGYALEAEAKGILVGLGFENSQFYDNPKSLSGGWRMRLEIAKLLINDPNFIVLDEPTNHLDLPSLAWLETYLKSFKGTLLFVSHDRDFINNLATMIIHISNARVNVYNGDFEAFLGQKEERETRIAKEREAVKKQQNHLQEFVDRFRAKATKAKQAQNKLRIIERLKQIENKLESNISSEKKSIFKIHIEKQSGKVVFDISNATIGYNGFPLSKSLDLRILRGDKIAIIGANGIGKSTLLKSVIGEIPWIDGKYEMGANVSIGYYAQEQLEVLDPSLDALENILKISPETNYQQARTILGGLLITKDEVKKKISVLSGGEKSKVAIAALLAQKNNFLILDEPTNHLDMSSVEALSEALSNYEGTVLMVSHNRAFISSFATHIFKMDKHNKAELFVS
ncbi:MAG: ATP-binding cassette domain-containing protein [Holosporales bacterium]|jgi:ATP-binding cassette subfamily F protein 3|nr:ATP-binding cassette domain-containing protein [Holosporales bacterium]